jgi:hypothetical protein
LRREKAFNLSQKKKYDVGVNKYILKKKLI